MIPQKYLLLHDIRSVHNVGSIFRTADGVGVDKIFISGHTPQPIDRFARKRKDLAKVALGAEDSVMWEYLADPVVALKKMKKDGVLVVSLEQDPKSVDYRDESVRKLVAKQSAMLILGSEVDGVGKDMLKLSDYIIEIPMEGKKESLNVSVAGGIAMYSIFQ